MALEQTPSAEFFSTAQAFCHKLTAYVRPLHPDPLHLVEAEFLAPPVVELRRARAGVVRHLRRLLQRAAVLQIRRDPGRAEAVIANLVAMPAAAARRPIIA